MGFLFRFINYPVYNFIRLKDMFIRRLSNYNKIMYMNGDFQKNPGLFLYKPGFIK